MHQPQPNTSEPVVRTSQIICNLDYELKRGTKYATLADNEALQWLVMNNYALPPAKLRGTHLHR